MGTLLLELAARLRDLQTGCEYGLLATQIGACGSQFALLQPPIVSWGHRPVALRTTDAARGIFVMCGEGFASRGQGPGGAVAADAHPTALQATHSPLAQTGNTERAGGM